MPHLQVNKENERATVEGSTRLFEIGGRAYFSTGSSIDPTKMANANQFFVHGAQVQANLVHSNYAIKYEPKIRSQAGKEVKTKLEGSFDGFIGATDDARTVLSFGQYPAIQIQRSAFIGARAELQGNARLNVAGHDIGELKLKGNVSVGAEAAGTMSFGKMYDSIQGETIVTGVEFGGVAFAGASCRS